MTYATGLKLNWCREGWHIWFILTSKDGFVFPQVGGSFHGLFNGLVDYF